jgi:hypothetical protein
MEIILLTDKGIKHMKLRTLKLQYNNTIIRNKTITDNGVKHMNLKYK